MKEKEDKHEEKEPEIVDAPNWESIAKYKAAELENYIKRTKDSVQSAFNDGKTHVVMQILPLGDSLIEAQKTIKSEADRKGIEILSRKFESLLTQMGLEEIKVSVGDTFDPFIHQSITQAESGSKNKIVEVYNKGYKFAGKVIRPATVRI